MQSRESHTITNTTKQRITETDASGTLAQFEAIDIRCGR
jgi:hypothetical protein